jgi:TolB-like protein
MSNDPEQEYFSDGMAEEILNALTQIKDLKVAGRTSSFQFKNKNIDLKEVGEKLGVHTVLEGSVRKQANTLRVTAQLINVDNGFHLWSERYDRDLNDVFAIQDEIAAAITERLKITFSAHEGTLVSKTITENTEANDLYLKGRFFLNRRGSYILRSIPFFEQAIAVDPNFALAYTGLADAYLLATLFSFVPAKEAMPKAKEAADAAIRINPMLCEPYASLGFYYEFYEWNWQKSKYNYLKSLDINPDYAQGRSWYANFYLCWVEGNFKEAIKQGEIALKKEPLCAIISGIQASVFYTAQRYEEALSISESAIELDSNSYVGWRFSGLALSNLGKHKQAIQTFEEVIRNTNRYQIAVEDLILAYVRDGSIKEATELFNELENRYNHEYIAPAYLGIAASWLGKIDLSLDYLEKAVVEKDATLILLKYYPNVSATLKEEERFKKVMATINFPDTTISDFH